MHISAIVDVDKDTEVEVVNVVFYNDNNNKCNLWQQAVKVILLLDKHDR